MSNLTTAFVGLGVMGYPMAGYLAKSGYPVSVFNRSGEKAERWKKAFQGRVARTPREAAENADLVFVCVGNDQDVRSVTYGEDGILAGLKAGAILVDHTTTSAQLAQELNQSCIEIGAHFIDAPVSGGQAGAENACLTIMCGGEEAAFQQAAVVMNSYAKQVQLLGKTGQGQRCKMVNQICIAGVLQGLSEALVLAEKSGLPMEQVVNTLQHGAAGSWQMVNRLGTMSKDEFNFGFAVDWMIKDLGICLDEAAAHGIQLPLTKEVDQRYKSLRKQGMGRMDTSVLVRSLKQDAVDTAAQIDN